MQIGTLVKGLVTSCFITQPYPFGQFTWSQAKKSVYGQGFLSSVKVSQYGLGLFLRIRPLLEKYQAWETLSLSGNLDREALSRNEKKWYLIMFYKHTQIGRAHV